MFQWLAKRKRAKKSSRKTIGMTCIDEYQQKINRQCNLSYHRCETIALKQPLLEVSPSVIVVRVQNLSTIDFVKFHAQKKLSQKVILLSVRKFKTIFPKLIITKNAPKCWIEISHHNWCQSNLRPSWIFEQLTKLKKLRFFMQFSTSSDQLDSTLNSKHASFLTFTKILFITSAQNKWP